MGSLDLLEGLEKTHRKQRKFSVPYRICAATE